MPPIEMNDGARFGEINLIEWTITGSVRIDVAMGGKTGQPAPCQLADQLEIVEARILTVKQDAFRGKTTFPGRA